MFSRAIIGLSLLLILTGCAVNTNTNRYLLNGICIQPHCCNSCYTLLVSEPTAQSGYDTDQMMYLKCPYELKVFSKNRWVVPPHEMLTAIITQGLRNTCFFRVVVTPPFSGETNYKLETRLVKLQQEFFCRPSRVRMVLHAVLIDTNCHQAIAEKVFEAVTVAPKDNPYGGVVAANEATRIIVTQLSAFVIAAAQQRPSLPKPRHIYSKEFED